MEKEVNENGYIPENFLFIFPILKGNTVARQIRSRFEEFWINKFKDPNYIDKVVRKNKNWVKHNDACFEFVILP